MVAVSVYCTEVVWGGNYLRIKEITDGGGLRLQGAIRVMARLRSPMTFLYEALLQQKELIEGVLKNRR